MAMPISLCGLRTALVALGLAALVGCAAPGGSPPPATAESAASSPLGSYLAGRFARSSRDTSSAAGFFSSALADDPGNPLLIQRTFTLLVAAGRVDEGIALAKRLPAAEQDGTQQVVLAIGELKAGNASAAAARLGALPRNSLNTLLGPLLQSWALAAAGAGDRVLATISGVAGDATFGPLGGYHRVLLQQVLGRTREAEQAYKALLDSASGSSPPRLLDSYAMFLAAQDRTDEARRVMELQVQRNPDNQIALQRLQAVGRGLREPLVADAQGGAAEALLTTASLLTREDLGEVVEFYLQLALYLRPKFDAVLFLLGDLRENRKNWDGAVEAYRAIAPDSPYFQSARVREAWALNGKGEVEPAIGVLTRLTQQFPDSNEPAIALADMLRGKERFAEAVREYDRVIGRATPVQQRHWALFYSRGIAHERSKQWGKAEADFLKALELQPEQPLVLNYLGYSWIDRGENLHRARTMVERAVELRPNDGFIIDSLGWALYRLGDYQGAVVKLERAVELQPDDPVINDHLGDAYWRVGRQVEARFQWQRSLGLKPEAEAKAATERKLAVGLPPAAPQGSRAASNG